VGQPRFFSYDVTSHALSVRGLTGYIPQDMSLWTDLIGWGNMLIYSKIYGLEPGSRRKVIEELLELMELTDASRKLVKTYYGGMIRRLEIATTLMSRPRLPIHDDPIIGLDPRARMMVWENLLAYKKDRKQLFFRYSLHV
jgi:ABC-2 type transport system ATP-binding protein